MNAATITVRRAFVLDGKAQAVGGTLTVSRTFAAELVANGKAEYQKDSEPPLAQGPLTTENTPQTVAGASVRARKKESDK